MENEVKENLNLFYYSKARNRLIMNEKDRVMIGAVNQDGEFIQDLFPVTGFEIEELPEMIVNSDPSCDRFYITTDDGNKFGFRVNELRGKCYPLFCGLPFSNVKEAKFDNGVVGYILDLNDNHHMFSLLEGYLTDNDMNESVAYGAAEVLYARSGVYIFNMDDGGNTIKTMPKSSYRHFTNIKEMENFSKNKEYIYPMLSDYTGVKDTIVLDKDYNGTPMIHSINKSTGEVTKKTLYYINNNDEYVKFKSVKYIIKNPNYKYGTPMAPFIFVVEDGDKLLFVVPHVSYEGKVNCRYIGHIGRYVSEHELKEHGTYLSYDDEYVYASMFDFTDAHIERDRYYALKEKISNEYYSNNYDDDEFDKMREKYNSDLKKLKDEHQEKLQELYKNIKLIKTFPILKIDRENGELIDLDNNNGQLYWGSNSSSTVPGEMLFINLKKKCMHDTREKDE